MDEMVEGQGSGGCRWRPVVNVPRFSVGTAGIEGYSIGWICDNGTGVMLALGVSWKYNGMHFRA